MIVRLCILIASLVIWSCGERKVSTSTDNSHILSAAEILGHPEYQAISYGGYRSNSRDVQPTISMIKEDLQILHAMGIRIIRTYNVHLPHASNVVRAIAELKDKDKSFEMYVMLGAWINCKNAWTSAPDHDAEDVETNQKEIATAIELIKSYPDIIKILAVGNEAMVKWAASYFVQPGVILKYVRQLQALKREGQLPSDLWITSSDNFASWGGGGQEYHVDDLNSLIGEVDYLSIHTYPMHDTHYNPDFWGNQREEEQLAKVERIDKAMIRAVAYAQEQYNSVKNYIDSLGISKPIHIGESGWASSSNGFYGAEGSGACDEYKEGLYYKYLRKWTTEKNIACFYFEAFDENWKDAQNPGGSENHFGLFTIDGQAKYALWEKVDQGVFVDLGRNGHRISKSYGGDESKLLADVNSPPIKSM